jgi:LAO/AO transport system kinase
MLTRQTDRLPAIREAHEGTVAGDRNALARLLTLIEEDPASASPIVWTGSGAAHIIGITGPAGAGKSTLTGALITSLRADGGRVAVLAVDPSSSFSGGAILGDRLRMSNHVLDPDVFIRSTATRGSRGGLAASVPLAIKALDSAGFSHVLIETVGVGQSEIDIARFADTIVVVLAPGWGDGVQAIKAGLLEIADIFVMNKADLPNRAQAVAELKGLYVGVNNHADVPVIETTATTEDGVSDLRDALMDHRSLLLEHGGELLKSRRDQTAAEHVRFALRVELERRREGIMASGVFDRAIEKVADGRCDPWTTALGLIEA